MTFYGLVSRMWIVLYSLRGCHATLEQRQQWLKLSHGISEWELVLWSKFGLNVINFDIS